MKHFKIFLILLTALLAIACESEKAPSFLKGNPYGKEFAGLSGPVKYVVYSTYHKKQVVQAIRNDYSTEGVLVKSKTFEKGDSIVYHYIYDPSNNIQDISGTDITDYKAQYQKGTLVKEWLFSDKKKKNGITNRYRIKGETLIKKVNDIRTGAGTTYTYLYNSRGIILTKQIMVNDGSYSQYHYDEDDHLTSIGYYTPKGKLKYEESITSKYDNYNNCTLYVARRNGKIVEHVKISYKYYTEDELKNSTQQAESAITNISVIRNAISSEPTPPSDGLMTAIILISIAFWALYLCYAQKHWNLFRNLGGKVGSNGMRRMWMYNAEPYVKMGTLLTSVIAAFLSAIILLLLCGGVIWVIFWGINLFIWGIIIVGWILLIGGIIALLFRFVHALIAIIVGGIIVIFSGTLKEWGEMIVDWGTNFLDHVNAVDWTISILQAYGETALLIIVIPLALFLAIALLCIVVSLILRTFEFIAIKIYNVNRPCPICGNKQAFVYMVDGKEYPLALHPGLYGVFYQTNHHTGTRVPTMLLNGKSKLTRKCPHCGQLINTSHDEAYGTDIHIGIVGDRSCGKSYMLYSGLELLSKTFGKDLVQIDADRNNDMNVILQRIHHKDGIQTAVKNRYKAIQFRLTRKFRPMPYQLFFYDVAGENFNVNADKSPSALEFYSNVKTILFVIDPTLLDIQKAYPSTAFAQWHKLHGNPNEQYDLEATISTLKNIIEQVGRKTKDIDIIITCSKKDLGYLQNSNYPYEADEMMIQKFIKEELGLFNLDNAINNWFKSVGYSAVSAIDENSPSLKTLFLKIVKI